MKKLNSKKILGIIIFVLLIFLGFSIVNTYKIFSNTNLSEKKVVLEDIKKNQQSVNVGTIKSSSDTSAPKANNEPIFNVSYDFEDIKEVSEDDVVAARIRESLGKSNSSMIAAMWIPDISLNLGIYKGFSGDNQYLGACTYGERSLGSGNYVLIGHNIDDKKQLFSTLQHAEKGMVVYITDYEHVYIYEVDYREIVHEDRGDLLEDTQGKAIATLATCYGGVGTDKRTVVGCTLIKTELLQDSGEAVKTVFGYR